MKRKEDSMAFAGQKGNRVADKVDDDSKSQELGPSFADLPGEITTHILLKLPIKPVLICRCVCKSWKTVVSDPNFARLHFIHAPVGVTVMIRTNGPNRVSRNLHLLEYEPEKFDSLDKHFCCREDEFKPNCNKHMKLIEPKFKLPLLRERSCVAGQPSDDRFAVVNSCNGFLCLCDPKERDPLVVCNPITGEFIRLPGATRIAKMRRLISSGLGFDPKTNEYKVMRMSNRYVEHPEYIGQWMFDGMVVEMHTLGTSTWRNVGVYPMYFVVLNFPTCVNGALHWIGFDDKKGSILSFNLDTEEFQSFPSPPRVFERNGINSTYSISMGELRGSLYICTETNCCGPVTMWVMEKYGIGGSWTEVFSIYTLCRNLGPLIQFQLKKGSATLMYNYSGSCFVYYESWSERLKYLKVCGIQSKFEVIPHIPSLISLKDAVKGDNVEVLNVYSRCAAMDLREENEVLFLAEMNVRLASF